jgi:GNAT superfamily N-acetyltransferase
VAGEVVRLGPEHDRSAFDSGEPSLDRWLREHAGQSDRRDGARTYVLCDGVRAIGYYSVCTFSVEAEEAPRALRIGRHPIPAILLARLAVDRRCQGRGIGSRLLVDSLVRVVRVADEVAARLLVVDALHERAATFYQSNGFRPLDEEHALRLYLPMQDIRRTLAAAR